MAVYHCFLCDQITDGDYNPPTVYQGELICEYCRDEFMPETTNPTEVEPDAPGGGAGT